MDKKTDDDNSQEQKTLTFPAIKLSRAGFHDILSQYFQVVKDEFSLTLLVRLAYMPFFTKQPDITSLKESEVYTTCFAAIKEMASTKPRMSVAAYPKQTASIDTIRLHAASVIYLMAFGRDILHAADDTWSNKLDMWCCKTLHYDSHLRSLLIENLSTHFQSMDLSPEIVQLKLNITFV